MNCLQKAKEFVKESGLEISDSRLAEFARIIESRRGDYLTKAEFAAGMQKVIDEDIARFMEKKRAADVITLAARETAVKSIMNKSFGTTVAENMRAWLDGGSLKKGDSVNLDPRSMTQAVKGRLLSMWARGIESIKDEVMSGRLDKDIFVELHAIQNGLPTGKTQSKSALLAAQVLNSVQNQTLELKKAYNPYLEKADQYLIRRIHDRTKVGAVEKEEWVGDAMKAFGEKSFPELTMPEKADIMRGIYAKIKAGTYGTLLDDSISDKMITMKGDGGNIMKRMARDRVLESSGPEATFEYNQKYGYGNIDETIKKVIGQSSRDIALLDKFGPNPTGLYEGVYRRVMSKADEAGKAGLVKDKKLFDNTFNTVMGLTEAPAQGMIEKVAQNVLAANYVSLTGGALLRSLPDIAIAAGKLGDLNGKTIFQNGFEIASEYAKGLVSSAYRTKSLENLSMFAHATSGDILRNLGGVFQEPGKMAALSDAFGSLSLLKQHVDSMRNATALVLARHLSDLTGTEWGSLPKTYQDGLLRYGIREAEWKALGQATRDWGEAANKALPGGSSLLTPEGVIALPDPVIENYLRKTGQLEGEATKEVLDLGRYKLSQKLGVMLNDHADYGSVTANTRQRTFLTQGTSINDPMGVTYRLLGQFKSAALATSDAYRRTYYSGQGPKGNWAGVAQTMALSMFMWTVGEYAKQMAEGKTPEDPTSPGFIARATIGSGAGGLFADTLAQAGQRNGVLDAKSAILANLAGPTVGKVAELGGIGVGYAKALVGSGKAPNLALAKWATSQIPGQNLFYTRAAFNYYFANGIKEFLGPGYLGQLERGVNKTPGLLDDRQSYFMMRPTESPVWPREILQ